jgi:pSer/pThr/pTyr-binding forkhead associated (FHA) protein
MPQAIPLKDGLYEVGRASPADIQINIPTVSSRHALLRVEDNKICITDLNSTNGTLVDGKELGPMDNIEVEIGSEVIFGDMYLAKFRLDEMPDDAPLQDLELSDQASTINPNNTVFSR